MTDESQPGPEEDDDEAGTPGIHDVARMTDPDELRGALVRALRSVDQGRHYDGEIPRVLRRHYRLAPDAWAGHGRKLQGKYLKRRRNIARAMNRVHLYLPELVHGPPCSVLELSTGHGAILEVLRHYGHTVLGNDYPNMVSGRRERPSALFRSLNDPDFVREVDDYGLPIPTDAAPDWPYRPIIESVGLPMNIFDAGCTPYPVADGAHDYVLCFQAIEHYCHPRDWMAVVAEMRRIARRGIFILLNPMLPDLAARSDYAEAFEGFRSAMRRHDEGGFRCVGVFVNWGQALGFKLMRIDP